MGRSIAQARSQNGKGVQRSSGEEAHSANMHAIVDESLEHRPVNDSREVELTIRKGRNGRVEHGCELRVILGGEAPGSGTVDPEKTGAEIDCTVEVLARLGRGDVEADFAGGVESGDTDRKSVV